VAGFCEHGNEPLGFIECWKFLEWLRQWCLLKKDPAAWRMLVTQLANIVPTCFWFWYFQKFKSSRCLTSSHPDARVTKYVENNLTLYSIINLSIVLWGYIDRFYSIHNLVRLKNNMYSKHRQYHKKIYLTNHKHNTLYLYICKLMLSNNSILFHCHQTVAGGTCYKPEGRGFKSRWGQWIFQLTWSFQPYYGPGVDSASNRNEHQESSWG
jgi:hypothetical protein